MGWKTSMIIIESPTNFEDDNSILKAIGKEHYKFKEKVPFWDCLYPRDKSMNIGRFNGNIIICEDYQVTVNSLDKAKDFNLTIEEQKLSKLFPNSEIVIIACHSVVNYHGYSLIQNGNKTRLKTISADTPKIEFGRRTIEEETIYKDSYQIDGKNYWKNEIDEGEDFSEDQLMETFVFGFAKRRLRILLHHIEAEEVLDKVIFKKYKRPKWKFKSRFL